MHTLDHVALVSGRYPYGLILALRLLVLASGFLSSEFLSPRNFLSAEEKTIVSSETAPVFYLSEKELQGLVRKLAPKVNLFRDIWEKDPKAEFFGGTTRDFIYWVLKPFRNISDRAEMDRIKQELLKLPVIDIRSFLHFESDIDVMTQDENLIAGITAENYGIRKIDSISFDRFDPLHEMGKNEMDQGSIPTEKIRLQKKGLLLEPHFGNGLREILTGRLSIQIPDPQKFWETHYAKQGLNHPILLAFRYIRNLAQDYLHRYGEGFPDIEAQKKLLPGETVAWIQETIRNAMEDPRFRTSLQKDQFSKWLSGSVRKGFRGYSNATAAFQWFQFSEVDKLQRLFPNQIPSLHEFLLIQKWDEEQIRRNWRDYGNEFSDRNILVDPKVFFTDGYFYHGAGSSDAFRSMIFQGAIPSASGSAGRGLYGVPIQYIKTAEEFAERGGDKKLIVRSEVSKTARAVDISKGRGQTLFQKWLGDQKLKVSESNRDDRDLIDQFAEAFGFDMVIYDYNPLAVVVKNRRALGSFQGLHIQLMSLEKIHEMAKNIKTKEDFDQLLGLMDFNHLNADEGKKILLAMGAEEDLRRMIDEPLKANNMGFYFDQRFYYLIQIFNSSGNQLPKIYGSSVEKISKKALHALALDITQSGRSKSEIERLLKNILPSVLRLLNHFLNVIELHPEVFEEISRDLDLIAEWADRHSYFKVASIPHNLCSSLMMSDMKARPLWGAVFRTNLAEFMMNLPEFMMNYTDEDDQNQIEELLLSTFFNSKNIEDSLNQLFDSIQIVYFGGNVSIWRDRSLKFWNALKKSIETFKENHLGAEKNENIELGESTVHLMKSLKDPQGSPLRGIDAIEILYEMIKPRSSIGLEWKIKLLGDQLAATNKSLSHEDLDEIAERLSSIDPVEVPKVAFVDSSFELFKKIFSTSDLSYLWKKLKHIPFFQRYFAENIMNQPDYIRDAWEDILSLARHHKVDQELARNVLPFLDEKKKQELKKILGERNHSLFILSPEKYVYDNEFKQNFLDMVMAEKSAKPPSVLVSPPRLEEHADFELVLQYLEKVFYYNFPISERDRSIIEKSFSYFNSQSDLSRLNEGLWNIIQGAANLESAYRFLTSFHWAEILGEGRTIDLMGLAPLQEGTPPVLGNDTIVSPKRNRTAGELGIHLLSGKYEAQLLQKSNPNRVRASVWLRSDYPGPWGEGFYTVDPGAVALGNFKTFIYFEVDPRAREGIDFSMGGGDLKSGQVLWHSHWALKPIDIRSKVRETMIEWSQDIKYSKQILRLLGYLPWNEQDQDFVLIFKNLISHGTVNRELVKIFNYLVIFLNHPELLEFLIKAGDSDLEIEEVLQSLTRNLDATESNFENLRNNSKLFKALNGQKLTLENLRALFATGFSFDTKETKTSEVTGANCLEDLKGVHVK